MSAKYHVVANQDEGGRWDFTREQLAGIAAEFRPGSEVSGPFGDNDAYHIDIPGEWRHEVLYFAKTMGFTFEEEGEDLRLTAGLVFQVLQRLAPDVPAVWVASFDGEMYPVRLAGRTEDDFVRELLSL